MVARGAGDGWGCVIHNMPKQDGRGSRAKKGAYEGARRGVVRRVCDSRD